MEQAINDPQDRQAYDACVQRYLDCTRQLVADPALRRQYGQAALLKAANFSNSAVQQRMVRNYGAFLRFAFLGFTFFFRYCFLLIG